VQCHWVSTQTPVHPCQRLQVTRSMEHLSIIPSCRTGSWVPGSIYCVIRAGDALQGGWLTRLHCRHPWQAVFSFCNGSGGSSLVCYQAAQAVARNPGLAGRPAGLCHTGVGMCSADCVSRLGLDLCSATGSAVAGAPTPAPSTALVR
jgi:hypothetical protein